MSQDFEKCFLSFHKDTVSVVPNPLENLEKKILSKYPESPIKIVNYY